ncbi:MAG: hypothetical protein JWR77_960 [Rhizorhabdus sp.]|nr:hypothetical protein [Rhizorhabdus sp.]
MAEKPVSNVRRLRVVIGRSQAPEQSIIDLARAKTSECIEILAQIAASDAHTASARISAATALIDRGWGRPTTMTITDATPDELEEGEISLDDILAARAEVVDEC